MTRQAPQWRMMETSEAARLRFAAQMAEYAERLGARIRERREELSLSRRQLARELPGSTSENDIYRWEKGKHRPHDDTLQHLAKALGVSVSFFYADEERPTPDLFGNEDPGQLEKDIKAILRRLDRIEAALDVQDQITELRAGIATLAADNLRRTQEQQAPAETDHPEEPPAAGV